MSDALINPEMLVWARTKARMSVEDLAQRTKRPVAEVIAWERGEARPSLAQARNAAQAVKQPLALLYLPQPPEGFQPLQDFRTIDGGHPDAFSPELEFLIEKTRDHQDWVKEFLLAESAPPAAFVGTAKLSSSPESLAAEIRLALDMPVDEQLSCKDVADALRCWIHHAEETRIFVIRDGSVDSSEARGFVLADPMAPFVYINANDSDGGKLFSLAHELAHLWLGESGLLDFSPVFSPKSPKQRVERFCNAVAACLLLDPYTFDTCRADLQGRISDVPELIETLASRFRVSQEVVARRLLDQNVITREDYLAVREACMQGWLRFRERRSARAGGGDHYWTTLARNSRSFTTLVLEAFAGGFINCRDASGLLSTKVNHLSKLAHYAGFDISLGAHANA